MNGDLFIVALVSPRPRLVSDAKILEATARVIERLGP
jgi:hypothetical protein